MGQLRVALVHSFYRSENPSGENVMIEAELAALRRGGVDATLVAVSTDDLADDPLYRVRAAARIATGRGRDPLDVLTDLRPHVVHVHNLFPNLGRGWVRRVPVPLVHTLHNFRPICAAGTLFRDGKICTLCPDGDPLAGLRYACYRDSRLATLPLTIANWSGPENDPVLARADRLLMLSRRSEQVFRRAGLSPDRMTSWSNFLSDEADPGRPDSTRPRDGWLVVARLEPEKGVLELVERWPAGVPLTVVGDGPQHPLIRAAAAGNQITLRGRIPREEVLALMRGSIGLVVPSRWYETFGLVYVEALACGLPVLAFEPNTVSDFVERDGTGAATTWASDLAEELADAESRFPTLSEHCRDVFEASYAEATYLRRARDLYRSLAG